MSRAMKGVNMVIAMVIIAVVARMAATSSNTAVQIEECSVVEENNDQLASTSSLYYSCLLAKDNSWVIFSQIKGPRVRNLLLTMSQDLLNYAYQDDCFIQLSNLAWLKIIAPFPFHISSRALDGLNNLEVLIINGDYNLHIVSNRNIENAHRWGTSNLTRADLNSTSPTFGPGWLKPVINLRLLNIARNNISSFRTGEFCHLQRLESLYISYNIINTTEGLGITCETSSILCTSCLSSLKLLHINNNLIQSLNINFHQDLPQLQTLKASGCRISSLPYDADCIFSASMQDVDMSNNMLSSFNVVNQSHCNRTRLQRLQLQNNRLGSLSPGLFRCIRKLKHLNLNTNYLSDDVLVSASLNSLSELEWLDLSNNHNISRIQNAMFDNLRELQEFRCTDCGLKFIEHGAFTNLHNLRVLDLSRNSLTDPDGAVVLPSLERLYLNQNLLQRFPNYSASSNISILEIDGNMITMLEPFRMNGLRNLRRLSLAFNDISHVPDHAFSSTFTLEELLLNNNKIKTIKYQAFNGLSNLLYLRLDNNFLTEMQAIKGSVVKSLRHFNISKNLITKTGHVIMHNIEWVDISWNQISEIDYNFFKIDHLKFANFSHNKLRFFHNNVIETTIYPRPEILLAGNPLHCDCRMEWLKYTKMDRSLAEIVKAWWRELVRKPNRTIYTHMEDPILGDPSMFKKYFMRIPDLDKVHCTTVTTGQNASFSSLKPKDFVCPYQSECYEWNCEPGCCDKDTTCHCRGFCYPQCSCYRKHDHSVNYMNCTSRNISVLPIQRPIYAKNIYLDGNYLTKLNSASLDFPHLENLALNNSHIAHIDPGTFKNLEVVKILDLHGNDLRQVQKSMFMGELRLEKLYLQENRISFIENGSFKHVPFVNTLWLHSNNLKYLNYTLFNSFINLTDLSLHDNPWRCDCHFGPIFQKWLVSKFDILKDLKQIYCEEYMQNAPMKHDDDDTEQYSAGELLSEAKKTQSIINIDFSLCNNASSVTFVHIKHNDSKRLIFVTVAFLLVAIILIVIYKNRLLIRVWAYNRYGVRFYHEENDSDKPYDIFIAYPKNYHDEYLVVRKMLPKLEDPNMSYRVCLECRDWDPRGGTAETIIASIQKSKRTIILVSEMYFETQWCEFMFDAAHYQVLNDKQLRLILILTDKELQAHMDRNMKLYMKTNASLVWGEKCFWEKLRYYLADNPRGADHVVGREFQLLKAYKERSTTQ